MKKLLFLASLFLISIVTVYGMGSPKVNVTGPRTVCTANNAVTQYSWTWENMCHVNTIPQAAGGTVVNVQLVNGGTSGTFGVIWESSSKEKERKLTLYTQYVSVSDCNDIGAVFKQKETEVDVVVRPSKNTLATPSIRFYQSNGVYNFFSTSGEGGVFEWQFTGANLIQSSGNNISTSNRELTALNNSCEITARVRKKYTNCQGTLIVSNWNQKTIDLTLSEYPFLRFTGEHLGVKYYEIDPPIPNAASYKWSASNSLILSSPSNTLTSRMGVRCAPGSFGGGNLTVQAINSCGKSQVGTTFVSCGNYSISESNQNASYVFPNPVKNSILNVKGIDDVKLISLNDMNGNVLVTGEKLKGNKIDISHLKKGTYLLFYEVNGIIESERFIKE